MIASKRLRAPKAIELDVHMLRRLTVRPTVGERRFFGALGLMVMACAEIIGSMLSLSIGIFLLAIPVLGALYEQRYNKVRVWFEGVQNVR